jgi:hypothetical protein
LASPLVYANSLLFMAKYFVVKTYKLIMGKQVSENLLKIVFCVHTDKVQKKAKQIAY